MKLFIIFTLVVAGGSSVHPEATSAPWTAMANATNRRDGVSYSTSVIHRNPDHPEKEAASSIDFQLNLGKPNPANIYHHMHPFTTSAPVLQSYQHHIPPEFSSHSLTTESTSTEEEGGYPGSIDNMPQASDHHQNTHPSNPATTYTNSHAGNHHTYYKSNGYAHPTLSESVHKYEVLHPTPQHSHKVASTSRPRSRTTKQPIISQQPQALAYTHNIFQKQEQPSKSSKAIASLGGHDESTSSGPTQSFNVGYSMKFGHEASKKPSGHRPTRLESEIITGSHKEDVNKPTQLNFGHDHSKYSYPSPSHSQQVLSQENTASKHPILANYPWKNLSPGVEIYQSKDINVPVSEKGTLNFDHDNAMGKSEGFDYSNAVDYLQEAQRALAIAKKAQRQQDGPEMQIVQLQSQFHSDGQRDTHSPIRIPITSDKHPNVRKIPLDTTLIREPFLTFQKDHSSPANTVNLPIHFDARFIQELGKEYQNILREGGGSPPTPVDPTPLTSSLTHLSNLLVDQSQQQSAYRLVPTTAKVEQSLHSPLSETQPNIYIVHPSGNTETGMTFKYPPNNVLSSNVNVVSVVPKSNVDGSSSSDFLFTPATNSIKLIDPALIKHLKMYKVKEQMHDHSPPQQVKFKVFGKPGNMFMRHQYEKVRLDRPTRVAQDTSQKRLVRDYTNIEMDLRPPPRTAFRTANFLRIKQ